MKKWRVTLPTKDVDYGWNEVSVVKADYFKSSNGELKFFNKNSSEIKLIFAKGTWLRVKRQPKMPTSLKKKLNRKSLPIRLYLKLISIYKEKM